MLAALACCRAFADDAEDAKKLQGTWDIVELIAYGKKVDFNAIKGTKFIFAKDKLTIQPGNPKGEEFRARTFGFKLDTSKKPATVELIVLDAENKGLKSVGIYELQGDTLRWCQSDSTDKPVQPKEFKADKAPFYLFTLKRGK